MDSKWTMLWKTCGKLSEKLVFHSGKLNIDIMYFLYKSYDFLIVLTKFNSLYYKNITHINYVLYFVFQNPVNMVLQDFSTAIPQTCGQLVEKLYVV